MTAKKMVVYHCKACGYSHYERDKETGICEKCNKKSIIAKDAIGVVDGIAYKRCAVCGKEIPWTKNKRCPACRYKSKGRPIKHGPICRHCKISPTRPGGTGLCTACNNAYMRKMYLIRKGRPIPDNLKDAPGPQRKTPIKRKKKLSNDHQNQYTARQIALNRSLNEDGTIPEWHFKPGPLSGLFDTIRDQRLIEAMLRGDFKAFIAATETDSRRQT